MKFKNKSISQKKILCVGIALFFILILAFARLSRDPILANVPSSQIFYDKEGRLLRLSLAADQRYRIFVPLKRMNPELIEAFLLREDQHFYSHFGVNPVSLLRAFTKTYVEQSRRIGGSTLTMQLARLRYGIKSKSIPGKVHQIAAAIGLELLYSKEEILESYLNLAPFGGNIEGVAAASLIYFRKDVAQLTLAEALSLAVLPQNPNVHKLAKSKEREALLEKWLALHPEEKYQSLEFELPLVRFYSRQLPFEAPHFINELMQRRTSRQSELHTTLDLRLQKLFEEKVSDYVQSQSGIGIKNASAILVDRFSGEIRAWVGSKDFFDKSIEGQVDGVSARRSPGSALKPFLYALGFDQGVIHEESLLKDSPFNIAEYDPENFDHDFKGPIAASEALILSRNIPAVFVGSKLKNPNLYEFLKLAKVGKLKPESYYGLAVILGGTEVSLEELAKLYLLLARRGELQELKWLKSEKETLKGPSLLSPEAAYMTEEILARNPAPLQKLSGGILTSVPVRNPQKLAWKTGTSFGFRDAWTLGITDRYVMGVWLGNFNNESNPALVGRDVAAPLFFQLSEALNALRKPDPAHPPKIPKGLSRLKVCAVSGALPGPSCQHSKLSFFIPGKSPIRSCDIHREVLISKLTGKRSCNILSKDISRKVYEFWPSDIQKLFRLAGLPRRTPPEFESECKMSDLADYGTAPEIISPHREQLYLIEPDKADSQVLPLQAVSDGESRKVYWFLDDEFLGVAENPSVPFIWKAKSGKFQLRAIDDLGRSTTRQLEIKLAKAEK